MVAYYQDAYQCFTLTFEPTTLPHTQPHIKQAFAIQYVTKITLFLKPHYTQSFRHFNVYFVNYYKIFMQLVGGCITMYTCID